MFSSVSRPLVAAIGLVITLAAPAAAEIDGHGPDAWQVTGVAANDVLNARMGPGTQYQVINRFAPGERGLQQVTCVPYVPPQIGMAMSDSQRAALPPRWCLMRSADLVRAGWVNAAYLAEDGTTPVTTGQTVGQATRQAAGAAGGAVEIDLAAAAGDGDLQDAMMLVAELYSAFEGSVSMADNPFQGRAAEFFSSWVQPSLPGHGADVLYDAQDFDGAVLRIYPDRDMPHIQGFMTVHVDLVNFGQMSTVTYNLRRDSGQPGAPVRIIRVEHPGWTFE